MIADWGTADSGTPVIKTAETGTGGVMAFECLEPGTYILSEISSPDNYEKDTKRYVIRVDGNGQSTAPLERYYPDYTEEPAFEDYYVLKDERRKSGEITVGKIWEGTEDGESGVWSLHSGTAFPGLYHLDGVQKETLDSGGRRHRSSIWRKFLPGFGRVCSVLCHPGIYYP